MTVPPGRSTSGDLVVMSPPWGVQDKVDRIGCEECDEVLSAVVDPLISAHRAYEVCIAGRGGREHRRAEVFGELDRDRSTPPDQMHQYPLTGLQAPDLDERRPSGQRDHRQRRGLDQVNGGGLLGRGVGIDGSNLGDRAHSDHPAVA
jgi:hypothetical protein